MSASVETSGSKNLSELRPQCLSFTETLGQSIANIAPSCGPVLGIPLVFATAGNGTWLTYIFATIAVALVGHHINQFARRSASPGALYTYVSDGLGPWAGVISGWGLVLAYFLTGAATLAAFANYANFLLGYAGIQLPALVLAGFGILTTWYIAFKDVNLSAKLMLVLEAASLMLIAILGAVVFAHKGFHVDTAQFALKGVSFDSLRIGLVLAFFSFVGFESATALGDEAKNPLKNIPKAVIYSAIFVGVIFVLFSYIEVMGFAGLSKKINEVDAPLSFLAAKNGIGFMGFFISFGAMISFWSCTIACTIAGARILYTMGKHKILHSSLTKVHQENDTPHVAITVLSVITFIIPAILMASKTALLDIFGWLGTIATLGFLLSYAMIVMAVPFYLYKRKELKAANILMAIISLAVLMIPIVGSIYPLPPYPYSLFPFIFLGWLMLSGSYFSVMSIRQRSLIMNMKKEIAKGNEKFAEPKQIVNQ